MLPHTETIYIALLGLGDNVYRPVLAFKRAHDLFEIASKNDDPEGEVWEFSSGSLVRCVERMLASGPCLVAVERVPARGLRAVPTSVIAGEGL